MLTQPVTGALDVDDDNVMKQTIEQRGCDYRSIPRRGSILKIACSAAPISNGAYLNSTGRGRPCQLSRYTAPKLHKWLESTKPPLSSHLKSGIQVIALKAL
jgi:hypothetical protein